MGTYIRSGEEGNWMSVGLYHKLNHDGTLVLWWLRDTPKRIVWIMYTFLPVAIMALVRTRLLIFLATTYNWSLLY